MAGGGDGDGCDMVGNCAGAGAGSGVDEPSGGVGSAVDDSLASDDLESMLSLGVGTMLLNKSSSSELSSSSTAS